jgi:hypothetical protein
MLSPTHAAFTFGFDKVHMKSSNFTPFFSHVTARVRIPVPVSPQVISHGPYAPSTHPYDDGAAGSFGHPCKLHDDDVDGFAFVHWEAAAAAPVPLFLQLTARDFVPSPHVLLHAP